MARDNRCCVSISRHFAFNFTSINLNFYSSSNPAKRINDDNLHHLPRKTAISHNLPCKTKKIQWRCLSGKYFPISRSMTLACLKMVLSLIDSGALGSKS